jgi:hypothetical protein
VGLAVVEDQEPRPRGCAGRGGARHVRVGTTSREPEGSGPEAFYAGPPLG